MQPGECGSAGVRECVARRNGTGVGEGEAADERRGRAGDDERTSLGSRGLRGPGRDFRRHPFVPATSTTVVEAKKVPAASFSRKDSSSRRTSSSVITPARTASSNAISIRDSRRQSA